MTAFDTGVALACRLTEALRTPVLEGLTPLERLGLAEGAAKVDGLLGVSAERWWKLSDGERAWLFMCADVRQIAVRCVGVDAGWCGVALLLCLGIGRTAHLNDSCAPERRIPEPATPETIAFFALNEFPDVTEDTPFDQIPLGI